MRRERRSLLANMSMRPATQVRCVIAPVGATAALFLPEHASHSRDRAEADRRWRELSLRGAALLCDAGAIEESEPPPRVVVARNPWLVLNVLARARGQVLMADAEALLGADAGPLRARASFDPRLVALARGARAPGEVRS